MNLPLFPEGLQFPPKRWVHSRPERPRRKAGQAKLHVTRDGRDPDSAHKHEMARPVFHLIRFHPGGRISIEVPEIIRSPGEIPRELSRAVPPRTLVPIGIVVLAATAAGYELRTSALQSALLSRVAERLTYEVERGPSPRITFPSGGPFDQRLGYARIPEFLGRLEGENYHIARQARFSEPLERLAKHGIAPPFEPPADAGLVLHGADGRILFDAMSGVPIFESYDEIPDVVVRSLLFIENRQLGAPSDPRRNPVVDWQRLAKAGLLYAGRRLGLPLRVEGGSTLATQLAKYQHSPGGRTAKPSDKLKQMVGASIDAYREGPDTRNVRRQIILDYLNKVPLGAAPGFGEVNGVPSGLQAWFGTDIGEVCRTLVSPDDADDEAAALYKEALALLCAARAPSFYLSRDRAGLESKVDYYAAALAKEGIISAGFAGRVQEAPLTFAASRVVAAPIAESQRKAVNLIRRNLVGKLGLQGNYDLDRIHVDADATIDVGLQEEVSEILRELRDPQFLDAKGLRSDRHLLAQGNPDSVTYSFLLMERSGIGNLLRVHTDTRDAPFDVNSMMKMELGSTAKLRTTVHYLEIVTELHDHLKGMTSVQLGAAAAEARDPITRWTASTMANDPTIRLGNLLDRALDRTYPAGTSERFFTGGGLQQFGNFESDEDGRTFTVREAIVHSVNLVFVRLMRDMVDFHEARLAYDPKEVIANAASPDRLRLLHEIAESEARTRLYNTWSRYRNLDQQTIVHTLLGSDRITVRRAAILYLAWKPNCDIESWLWQWTPEVQPGDAARMESAYGGEGLTIADYAWLLGVHPLDLWCGGELFRHPGQSWDEIYRASEEARRLSSEWLFKTRNRGAQDLRLRIRFEQDAFARMTPYWRRAGFPFERLIPSLATAIGGSGDRPSALADLIGIIRNDGIRRPTVTVPRMRFGEGTPYQTVVALTPQPGERIFPGDIARALRPALAGVVERGTARRLAGVFTGPDGVPLEVGGKTGSGDNRYKTFGPGGDLISSEAVSRTASFVFYIGDRYFGVITASVVGRGSGDYHFTSAYPVAILKLIAPAIEERIEGTKTIALPVSTVPRRAHMARSIRS